MLADSGKLKYDLETRCSVNGLKSNLQASCRQCLVCRDWLVSGGALSVGQYQRRGRLQQHTAVQRGGW